MINPKTWLTHHLDKVLLAIACMYLSFVAIWLFNQNRANSTAQNTRKNSSDAQFIAYLQQSLSLMERRQNSPASKPQPTSAQPSVKVPPAPPAAPPSANNPTVIERIYIPFYPQNQPPAAAPATGSTGSPPAPPPRPSSQAVAPPSTVPVFTPGSQLLPAPAPSTAASNSLIGLLESGEQSAAIFKIKGAARRYEVGEAIGSTGWRLKAVQNQTAILDRNGKSLYLTVGQGF
jgi:type II secretory pathway component PulC